MEKALLGIPSWGLLGVFDGHGGSNTSSKYLASRIPSAFSDHARRLLDQVSSVAADNVVAAGAVDLGGGGVQAPSALERQRDGSILTPEQLKQLFVATCETVESELARLPRMSLIVDYGSDLDRAQPLNVSSTTDSSGTTAAICLVTERYLVVANVGDSRAVLATYVKETISPKVISSTFFSGSPKSSPSTLAAAAAVAVASKMRTAAVEMSTDHKPNLPLEKERATRAGLWYVILILMNIKFYFIFNITNLIISFL